MSVIERHARPVCKSLSITVSSDLPCKQHLIQCNVNVHAQWYTCKCAADCSCSSQPRTLSSAYFQCSFSLLPKDLKVRSIPNALPTLRSLHDRGRWMVILVSDDAVRCLPVKLRARHLCQHSQRHHWRYTRCTAARASSFCCVGKGA